MKLTPEQLGLWFYTAFPAQFPEDSAEKWNARLSQLKGRERSGAIYGMKQGVNDILKMTRMMPEEFRSKVDEALAANGLPSVRKMELVLKK